MPNPLSNLFSGFMNAFGQTMQQQQQRQQIKEFKDLQVKKLKTDLDAKESQLRFQRQFGNLLVGSEMPPAEQGGGPAMPAKSVNQLLLEPQGQFAALKSGWFTPKDIGLAQTREQFQKALEQLPGAGGGGLPSQIVAAQGGYQVDPLSKLAAIGGQDITKIKEDVVSKQMRTPLSTTDLLRYQDAQGNPPPAGTTLNDIRREGYKPVLQSQIAIKQKLQGAFGVLDTMDPLVDQIFTDTSFWERLQGKGRNARAKIIQDNPNVVLYNGMVKGTKASIVKALGDSGTLTDADIERVDTLFPQLGTDEFLSLPDSRQIAKLKLQQLRGILKAIQGGATSLNQAIAIAKNTGGQSAAPAMGGQQPAPQQQALPEGIPQGSRFIGTAGGFPVYETPDGKQLRVRQ